jgi:uncharacterized membrane protein (UPF0127 family)
MSIYMKTKKHIIFSLLFLGAAVITVLYAIRYPQFFFGKGRQSMSTVHFPLQDVDVPVEIARDPYAWSRGLMFRELLAPDGGMLFVFPNEEKRSFWMKNTLIPLDMIFISKDKKIVTIRKNAMPCTTMACPQYGSAADAMYVLEVNAGFVDAYGIKEGDVVGIDIISH